MSGLLPPSGCVRVCVLERLFAAVGWNWKVVMGWVFPQVDECGTTTLHLPFFSTLVASTIHYLVLVVDATPGWGGIGERVVWVCNWQLEPGTQIQ